MVSAARTRSSSHCSWNEARAVGRARAPPTATKMTVRISSRADSPPGQKKRRLIGFLVSSSGAVASAMHFP
jgi:hypothetical protein